MVRMGGHSNGAPLANAKLHIIISRISEGFFKNMPTTILFLFMAMVLSGLPSVAASIGFLLLAGFLPYKHSHRLRLIVQLRFRCRRGKAIRLVLMQFVTFIYNRLTRMDFAFQVSRQIDKTNKGPSPSLDVVIKTIWNTAAGCLRSAYEGNDWQNMTAQNRRQSKPTQANPSQFIPAQAPHANPSL